MVDPLVLDRIYAGVVDTNSWREMLRDFSRMIDTDIAVSCRGFEDSGDPVDWTASERMPFEQIEPVSDIMRGLSRSCAGMTIVQGDAPEFSSVCINAGYVQDHCFLFGCIGRAMPSDVRVHINDYAMHLMRAARLRDSVRTAAEQAHNALTLLDMLHIPVMLVDRQLRVIVANSAVQKLEKAGVLRLTGRELRFSSTSAMERVRRAIEGIVEGTDAVSDMLIRLNLSDGGSFLAMIEPLDGVFMDTDAAPSTAVAAILLKDPERVVIPTEAALRELHGMPPAEARFASAMAEGLTIRDYSEREGLSETYIRDLSKQVMGRLGVNRQPDLVRAIVRLASDFDR